MIKKQRDNLYKRYSTTRYVTKKQLPNVSIKLLGII